MFERFTNRSRRALVLAQEEAKVLGHNFIGTEHILLGLIHEGEGVAATALESMGIRLADVREAVEEKVGTRHGEQISSPPFTPRAKKVLELSLREALKLGHNHIGTEHILLALVAEGEGVAAQVLVNLGVDLDRARSVVLALLESHLPPEPPEQEPTAEPAPRQRLMRAGPTAEPPRCSVCRASLTDTALYRDIAVLPAEGAEEGEQAPLVRVVFCSRCGTAVGVPVQRVGSRPYVVRQVAPARRRIGTLGASTLGASTLGASTLGASTREYAQAMPSAAPRKGVRLFPDEDLAPVNLQELPEGSRIELTSNEGGILDGHAGGKPVRLAGNWSREGSIEGTWMDDPLSVSWQLEASGTAGTAGLLRGSLGGKRAELHASFLLSLLSGVRRRYWPFESGDMTGQVGDQDLEVRLRPAAGGLGDHTVAAEGKLGETDFDVSISLSGHHDRGVVRGSVGDRPVRLDLVRLMPNEPVRLAGEYSGPAELLALLAGATLYFM